MDHAYDDIRDAARAEARKISRRLTDVMYVEIDAVFRAALLAGEEITDATLNIDDIKAKALAVVKKQLSA
ncbi:hypothetical protein [Sinimarinibacterium flocculans]|uniref:hypothetical protein n=1 Tax=Sinimarinibacterium flocculans TaxID=985250 RepID=UPI002491AA98|nr:hypothetical protein [Sinimarinibacterium flocculans]